MDESLHLIDNLLDVLYINPMLNSDMQCVSKYKKYIIYTLIFFVTFVMRFVAIQMKNSFFYDDLFTVIAATPNNLNPDGKIFKKKFNDYEFEKGKVYTGEQIKKSMFAMDGSIKSILKDLRTIRSANVDKHQPSLHCSLIRILGAGFDGLNPEDFVHRGCYLNLIFFVISFFFMFKLLSLIKDDATFVSLGLFFCFVPIGSTLTILLIRPYAMQECAFIIVHYMALLLWNKFKNNYPVNTKDIVFCTLTLSFFLQTGYFALIYFGLIFMYALAAIVFSKKFNYLKPLIFVSCFTIIFTIICYPGYFDLWTDNEHIGIVTKNASHVSFFTILAYLIFITKLITTYILYPIIIFIPTFFLLAGKFIPKIRPFIMENKGLCKEAIQICLIIFLSCFLWSMISLYVAPYKVFRYFCAVSVFFAFPVVLLSCNLKKYIQIPILIICFILSVNTSRFIFVPQEPNIMEGHQIPFVYRLNKPAEVFSKIAEHDIPLVIISNYWYNPNLYILFKNNQRVKFEDYDYINNSEYKKYIMAVVLGRYPVEKIKNAAYINNMIFFEEMVLYINNE